MTKIALVVLPAPCNLLSQPKLLQPVLYFLRRISGHRQIVGPQRAVNAFELTALAIAAHRRLGVYQHSLLHARQLQRPRSRQPCHAAARYHHRGTMHCRRCRQLDSLGQSLPEGAQAMPTLQRHAHKTTGQIGQRGRCRLAAGQHANACRPSQSGPGHFQPVAAMQIARHQCSTLPHSLS